MKHYTIIKIILSNLHFNNGCFPNNNPEYANEINADISEFCSFRNQSEQDKLQKISYCTRMRLFHRYAARFDCLSQRSVSGSLIAK